LVVFEPGETLAIQKHHYTLGPETKRVENGKPRTTKMTSVSKNRRGNGKVLTSKRCRNGKEKKKERKRTTTREDSKKRNGPEGELPISKKKKKKTKKSERLTLSGEKLERSKKNGIRKGTNCGNVPPNPR